MPIQIDKNEIARQVALALAEDVGSGDVTAQLIPPTQGARATVITREPGVLCGVDWFNEVFAQLDQDITTDWTLMDGEHFAAGQTLCTVEGLARPILSGERTALNFLQSLSGTATITQTYVQAVAGTPCHILDTRKTIPGLRLAQKYAVHCGGGHNHRIGLYDAYLIKENHIKACGSITAAVQQAKTMADDLMLELEVESLAQLQEAIAAGVQRVLLDNMDCETLREAVRLTNKRVELEASGGVTLEQIRTVAETGVDYISVGRLTKHLHAIDFSMRFK